MIAVNDEVAHAVARLMDRAVDHLDAAEMRAEIVAQELVVVAGHVDDARAFARLAQELLHHVVMSLRPVPSRAQLPAVDDVADEIDGVRVVAAQEVEQPLGLAAAGAEMDIREEERTKSTDAALRRHDA